MKLIELFEDSVRTITNYTGWLDNTGHFHEVDQQKHTQYLAYNANLFPNDNNDYLEMYDRAFAHNWIRLVEYPYSKNKKEINIEGKGSALKKQLGKLVQSVKSFDRVQLSILNENPTKVDDKLKFETSFYDVFELPQEINQFASSIKNA